MRCDGKMSFGGYVFPVNPYLIRIGHSRTVGEKKIPFLQSAVTDMGTKARTVSGEGELYGEHCEEELAKLKKAFQKGRGVLYVPSQKPFYAVFEELRAEGADIAGVIKYTFSFRESFEKNTPAALKTQVSDGAHSLWDYSYISGIDVGTLIQLNPDVKRPDDTVPHGRRVFFC